MTEAPVSAAKGLWWAVLLRGVFAIVFGILALVAPTIALTGIAIVFGAYALVDGVTEIAYGIRSKGDVGRGWTLFQGIVSILAGLAALFLPQLAGVLGGLLALWTIVIYSVAHGAIGLVSAAGVTDGDAKTWGIISGVITLLFGIVLAILVLLTPDATLLGLIWAVGIYALIFGVVLIVTAVQVRRGVSELTA